MSTFPFTPLHLEIFLCACTGTCTMSQYTPPGQAYILDLVKEGLIWKTESGKYRATEFGRAKLQELLIHLNCKGKESNRHGKAY